MNALKEKIRNMWSLVVEKKDLVIPIASAVVGAVIGGVVVSVMSNVREVPDFETFVED